MPSSSRNIRYANGARRRKACAQVRREEDMCALCGGYVDKELKHPHPASPSVDEIIPVSHGGSPYARDNLRLAHLRCNQSRGNGTRQRPVVIPYRSTRQW